MSCTFKPPIKAGLPWKNHSTRSRTSEKKPFLVILMWECGGFVPLPVLLMNPDMKKYWIKCWPSSAVPSLANFLSGSLALYSFLHNGPAKAKEMQRIIQDGCHPGSYEFKPLQSEDGVETCILFQDKCAAVQATALAFHPAFPPFIPPSFCRMPALVVHSGSWIPVRITAVQGCSKSLPWSTFCQFTQCRVSVHPVKADLVQSVQRTGNANSSTCLSALPWQLGDPVQCSGSLCWATCLLLRHCKPGLVNWIQPMVQSHLSSYQLPGDLVPSLRL